MTFHDNGFRLLTNSMTHQNALQNEYKQFGTDNPVGFIFLSVSLVWLPAAQKTLARDKLNMTEEKVTSGNPTS